MRRGIVVPRPLRRLVSALLDLRGPTRAGWCFYVDEQGRLSGLNRMDFRGWHFVERRDLWLLLPGR